MFTLLNTSFQISTPRLRLQVARLIPVEEAKQIKFIKALTALMNLLGYQALMILRLIAWKLLAKQIQRKSSCRNYPWNALRLRRPKNDTLFLKLEYYFGAEVIDILDINNININTGKPRVYKERAKEHAKLYLTGKTVTQHRAEIKAQEAEPQEAD